MSGNLFSPSWYRVAELKPRLRHHGQIHRHEYRGKIWFVLQDHISGRSHRFSPDAYQFLGLMDGSRSVQTIWETLNKNLDDKAPSQDEVIRLLSQLHAVDLLICDVSPDTRELFRRHHRQQRAKLKQRLWTPLAIRIPLLDPDKFLDRTYPSVRFLFGKTAALVWLIVVLVAGILAAVHWPDLTENVVDRALTPQNLLLLWLVYPLVKALHELGHAYLAKKYGAEVHEIGIMFLVLMPVPYVDVSAIWGFRDKRQRMLVGAAGIATELFLGALALFVWLSVEAGALHAIAFNVMLISGVSTLLFNGNPLLRFDGYYVFSDAIEIPNLGSRANSYLSYLFQRYLLALPDLSSPAETKGEKIWFVVYGIAAFFYRIFIMFVIILYIGGKFFAIGALLAGWAVITQALIPMGKAMSFLFTNRKVQRKRTRSNLVAGGFLLFVFLLVFVLPAPHWTRVEGVTWPPDKSRVRAEADGFIEKLVAKDGSKVKEGQVLIATVDPLAEARVQTLEARLKQLDIQLMAARTVGRVELGLVQEERLVIQEDLIRAKEKLANLLIRSPSDGVLILPQEKDLPGKFIRQGESLAFVLAPEEKLKVRAVVSQDDIGLVREYVRKVNVIPVSWGATSYQAEMIREIHGGSNQLPSAALGDMGGGEHVVSRVESRGTTTLERVFEVELGLPDEAKSNFVGNRVYVRFDHGYESLGLQAWRFLRQLFLRRFGV